MRALMVLALLAFLAVSFVTARPAENEEIAVTDDAEEPTDDEESSEDGETQDNNEETGEEEAIPAPKNESPPFWPRLGGHGPVLIHAKPRFLAIA
ncbi:uncharacterized protein LOC111066766 [Drosophila obscura]|uniref:uncharacterized protein LOC111066766 n=1 Tax=Drosophila obscura TaxID=7282 RepID=UPI001BB2C5CE|nr:uncharacterized protein LOC111066766 [Drosophila obscura]